MMKVKYPCIVLSLVGVVLPYGQFMSWVLENGLRGPLLVDEIASSRLATSGWLDVIVSALALLVFILIRGTAQQRPGVLVTHLGDTDSRRFPWSFLVSAPA
jgi:hypothetical protein